MTCLFNMFTTTANKTCVRFTLCWKIVWKIQIFTLSMSSLSLLSSSNFFHPSYHLILIPLTLIAIIFDSRKFHQSAYQLIDIEKTIFDFSLHICDEIHQHSLDSRLQQSGEVRKTVKNLEKSKISSINFFSFPTCEFSTHASMGKVLFHFSHSSSRSRSSLRKSNEIEEKIWTNKSISMLLRYRMMKGSKWEAINQPDDWRFSFFHFLCSQTFPPRLLE